MKRTDAYLCTLDVNSVTDMQMLEVIRKTVSISNKYTTTKKRVSLRGRKPEQKFFKLRTGNFVSYDWAGNIVGGIKNATKLDVYIHDRRN
jgi:hypothetical protein